MRLTRNVLLLVAWVSGLLLVALAFLWLRGCRAERLAQAHMLDELQAVRGGAEGVRYEQTKDPMDAHLMLVLDDGSWLVMAYWEMDHCLPRRALTLVKDSEGRYYQSDRQFRGKFTHYRRMLRMLEDARQIHDRPRERFLAEELSKDEIHMIARCRDLAEAMKIMEQSG